MDYKDTLLSNLESLLYDVLSEDIITPSEIHDCITKTVKDSYYYHKHHTSRSYELMTKLHSCDGNDSSSECKKSWNDFWEEEQPSLTYDEMIKSGWTMTADGFWIRESKELETDSITQVPRTFTTTIELDPASGECYMSLPPELLQSLQWTEGTQLNLTVQDSTLHITRA